MINDTVAAASPEDRIFRIDHYLAKVRALHQIQGASRGQVTRYRAWDTTEFRGNAVESDRHSETPHVHHHSISCLGIQQPKLQVP